MASVGFTPKQYRALLIMALLAGHASYAMREKARHWPTKTLKFHSPQEVQKNSGMDETNKEAMEDEAATEDVNYKTIKKLTQGSRPSDFTEDLQKESSMVEAKKEVTEEMAAEELQKESSMVEAKKEVMEEMAAEEAVQALAVIQDPKNTWEVVEARFKRRPAVDDGSAAQKDVQSACLLGTTFKFGDMVKIKKPGTKIHDRICEIERCGTSRRICLKALQAQEGKRMTCGCFEANNMEDTDEYLCCCKSTDKACRDFKGDDKQPAVFQKNFRGKSACCSHHRKCTGFFVRTFVQAPPEMCKYDEEKRWLEFLESDDVQEQGFACINQLRAYLDAVEEACLELDYRGRAVIGHNCNRFAQLVMDGLLVRARSGICSFATSFQNTWPDGTPTEKGDALALWCGVGVKPGDTLAQLRKWTKALKAHVDWETTLAKALNKPKVNQLDKCGKNSSFIKQHWGQASECLFEQPKMHDMLHLVLGRKPCSDADEDERCFEQTFMKEDELGAAARSGSFFAVQAWALSAKNASCEKLIPIIVREIEGTDMRKMNAKRIWGSVQYLACQDVQAPPDKYEEKKPVGGCYKLPFGIGFTNYAIEWCHNFADSTPHTDETIRSTLRGWPSNKAAYNEYGPIRGWNVAQVKNMRNLFNISHDRSKFNEPIGKWDTSQVTSMREMFAFAEAFNQPLNAWNTGRVTDMGLMFISAKEFNRPLDKWNTAHVIIMGEMFYDATNFNRPLDKWNTAQVTSMYSMFAQTRAFNQPLNSWNTGSVEDMKYMFSDAKSFNQTLNAWNISKVTYGRDEIENLRRK